MPQSNAPATGAAAAPAHRLGGMNECATAAEEAACVACARGVFREGLQTRCGAKRGGTCRCSQPCTNAFEKRCVDRSRRCLLRATKSHHEGMSRQRNDQERCDDEFEAARSSWPAELGPHEWPSYSGNYAGNGGSKRGGTNVHEVAEDKHE